MLTQLAKKLSSMGLAKIVELPFGMALRYQSLRYKRLDEPWPVPSAKGTVVAWSASPASFLARRTASRCSGR